MYVFLKFYNTTLKVSHSKQSIFQTATWGPYLFIGNQPVALKTSATHNIKQLLHKKRYSLSARTAIPTWEQRLKPNKNIFPYQTIVLFNLFINFAILTTFNFKLKTDFLPQKATHFAKKIKKKNTKEKLTCNEFNDGNDDDWLTLLFI